MSDFDTVLERLLIDNSFRAALGADPAAALAGYRLSPDEVDLLRSQVSAESGGERTVEARTSKAGIFGLLSPIGGLSGGTAEAGSTVGHAGFGAVDQGGPGAGAGVTGADDLGRHIGEAFGPAAGAGPGAAAHEGFGALNHEGFAVVGQQGPGEPGHGGFGPVSHEGFAVVGQQGPGEPGHEGFGPVSHAGFGPVHGSPMETGPVAGGGDHVPVGYHPHIDADGDGRWDHYTAVQHSDGSVDIYEDRNHDGIVDFDGHDQNADGVIERADYDENFDGVADTHMTDVNGDGWLDTRTAIPPPAS
jgi:hypothetical protein